jgi:hypothetical protein
MTERTRTIVTYAIGGFANFGSMGILIGGLSIMCPERRTDFLSLAWKTLFSGTLATIMAAAVVASLPYALFKSADEPLPRPAVTIQPAAVIPEVGSSSQITNPAPAPETAPAQPTEQTQ